MLQELQHRFPGRYERSHLRTLQRGVRKIRAQVLQAHEEVGPPQGPQENVLFPVELKPARSALNGLVSGSLPVCEETLSAESTPACSSNRYRKAEVLSPRTGKKTRGSIPAAPTLSKSEPGQVVRRFAKSAPQRSSREKGQRLTMERAVQKYFQAHRKAGHRPKTLEWHQMVLSHLHHYLRTECHLLLVNQITETIMRNWLASLAQTPTTRGSVRERIPSDQCPSPACRVTGEL